MTRRSDAHLLVVDLAASVLAAAAAPGGGGCGGGRCSRGGGASASGGGGAAGVASQALMEKEVEVSSRSEIFTVPLCLFFFIEEIGSRLVDSFTILCVSTLHSQLLRITSKKCFWTFEESQMQRQKRLQYLENKQNIHYSYRCSSG